MWLLVTGSAFRNAPFHLLSHPMCNEAFRNYQAANRRTCVHGTSCVHRLLCPRYALCTRPVVSTVRLVYTACCDCDDHWLPRGMAPVIGPSVREWVCVGLTSSDVRWCDTVWPPSVGHFTVTHNEPDDHCTFTVHWLYAHPRAFTHPRRAAFDCHKLVPAQTTHQCQHLITGATTCPSDRATWCLVISGNNTRPG